MISAQISAALIGYLGDYVKPQCFDSKSIETEILKNSITLRNLQLKEQVRFRAHTHRHLLLHPDARTHTDAHTHTDTLTHIHIHHMQ